jgi:hypothetical protein
MQIISLPKFTGKSPEKGGVLVPIELEETIPFSVKRVYFLKNTPPKSTRGGHCHFLEDEVFVNLAGSCKLLYDQTGEGKKELILDSPTKAVYIKRRVWHEFTEFTPDSLLLAFSSTNYLPGADNYLEDYLQFVKLKQDEQN